MISIQMFMLYLCSGRWVSGYSSDLDVDIAIGFAEHNLIAEMITHMFSTAVDMTAPHTKKAASLPVLKHLHISRSFGQELEALGLLGGDFLIAFRHQSIVYIKH